MSMQPINVSTTDFQIINKTQPGEQFELQIQLQSNTRKKEPGVFESTFSVEVYIEKEKDYSDKSFYIKHVLRALIKSEVPRTSKKFAHDVALLLYPEIRAKTTAVANTLGILQLPLPFTIS